MFIQITHRWIRTLHLALAFHDDVIKWKQFRVSGHLWGEFTGHRWFPLTKASDAELWRFLWSAPEQTVEQTIKTPVIWDNTMQLIGWVRTYFTFLLPLKNIVESKSFAVASVKKKPALQEYGRHPPTPIFLTDIKGRGFIGRNVITLQYLWAQQLNLRPGAPFANNVQSRLAIG